jgi:hypothetical protein
VSERVAAVVQVGEMIARALAAWPPLSTFTVVYEQSAEVAAEESDGDLIRLWLVAHQLGIPPEQWTTLHLPIFEIEAVTRDADAGSLTRGGLNAIAEVVAALSVDRSLGGRLQDLQEVDVGSTVPNGRNVAAPSLQIRAEFYTSRADWFTILAP